MVCFATVSSGCGRIGFDLISSTEEPGDGDGDGDGDGGVPGTGGTGGSGGTGGTGGSGGSAGMAGEGGTGGGAEDGGVDAGGPPDDEVVCVLDVCSSDFDRCPADPDKTSPGICGCGVPDDANEDGDHMPDCIDLCEGPDVRPDGSCACAASAADSDGDGIPNCQDWCPGDGDKTEPQVCGCGTSEEDTDGDGMPTCSDVCFNDPNKVLPGACGCDIAESDLDSDDDGQLDCVDACSGVDDASYVPDASCGVGYCRDTNTASSCASGVETACAPGSPLGADDVTCDLVDDDCNGVVDEGYPSTPTTCGTGACAATGTIGCVSGTVFDNCTAGTAAADDATCDGVDDDCDGSSDETYVVTTTTCGTGLCAATGQRTCAGGDELDSCTPGAAAANDASCNGIDNDCDGERDEDYVATPTTCGVGSCGSTGQLTCVNGSPSNSCTAGNPAASDASCDGVDQDCSGAADDDYAPTMTNCGVGACARTGQLICSGGSTSNTCAPGSPTADNDCDGADDDCDGRNDEHYVAPATSCGVGACGSTGVMACVSGSLSNTCTAGTPAANDASCNNRDDDCNGQRDEDYMPTGTSCGVGACMASGQRVCTAGTIVDTCMDGSAVADNDCDGVDDDCDSRSDEHFVNQVTSCGVGACASTGLRTCVAGSPVNSCMAGAPAANDASCDGVDQDCSGVADEDYMPTATSCGVGACAANGQNICAMGSVTNTCAAGTPAANDASCNNRDDDCNGQRDEDYAPVTTSCGVGACAAMGLSTCSMGVVGSTCMPGAPAANDASCNNRDDDCNGQRDEDYVRVATSCGVGACAANGQSTCTMGVVGSTCTPGSPAANDATCNNADDDCNGQRDEDYVRTPTSCGTGVCAANGQNTCSMGSVVNTCDPGDPTSSVDDPTYPGNGQDNDCDGATDEDSVPPCNAPDGVYSTTALHNIVVPTGCRNAVVRLWGGGGASGEVGGWWGGTAAAGGPGGYATRTFALTSSSVIALRLGQGGQNCGGAGANNNTIYSGGAGSTARGGNGTNGRDGTEAGGTGAVSSGAGDGGRGYFGGAGGGAGGGLPWNPFGGGGGGGAASVIFVDGVRLLAGGGGGGGGAGSTGISSGVAGGAGGSGCSSNGAAPAGSNGGGGGGGGKCDGTTNQAGSGRNPHVPAGVTLPANTAIGGNNSSGCQPGGTGYAIIDWQP